MAIKNIGLLGLFFIAGSCNNEGKPAAEINNDTVVNNITTVVDSISPGCYSQIVERDTSLLQFENRNNQINGSLSYNFYQKDRNEGTLQAEIAGDTINYGISSSQKASSLYDRYYGK